MRLLQSLALNLVLACISFLASSGQAFNVTTPRALLSKSARSKLGPVTARWTLFYTNPRAASLFLSDRFVVHGSGRVQIEHRLEKELINEVLKRRRTTKRGYLVAMRLMFLMPSVLSDSLLVARDEQTTRRQLFHDPRVVPLLSADEFCDDELEKLAHLSDWPAPSLRQYWKGPASSTDVHNKSWYVPLGPRFEFPLVRAKVRNP